MVSSQSKTYQQVIARFDGVVTQRNFDIGGLITADATSGTSMFSLVHRNVIGLRAAGRRPGVAYEDGVGVSPPLAHQCRTGLQHGTGVGGQTAFLQRSGHGVQAATQRAAGPPWMRSCSGLARPRIGRSRLRLTGGPVRCALRQASRSCCVDRSNSPAISASTSAISALHDRLFRSPPRPSKGDGSPEFWRAEVS